MFDELIARSHGWTAYGEAPAHHDSSGSFAPTDLGNAERFAAQHASDVRYVPGLGWFVWDARRWRLDNDGEVERRMKLTARSILAEAHRLDERDERQRLAKWSHDSESEKRLSAAVRLARSEKAIVLAADSLDTNPWLLNVKNGTIDLRTAELRAHQRDDFITKTAPVSYAENAEHSSWEAFLDQITDGDGMLRGFLQRVAGYSLTGTTVEEKLFLLQGPGATGKSTYAGAIHAVLGEYARTADFDTFLRRRGDAGVRNDIARLEGARLVVCNEVEPGRHLAEGLLKTITGGDVVTARFLYKEAREFRPAFKLWLVANDRPSVSAHDEAIWRRILQIPFLHVVPEDKRDPAVKHNLTHDPAIQTAILAWMVKGCLAWQENGLAVPHIVLDHTSEYRAENDSLRGWIEDCVDLDAAAWTRTAALHKSYAGWTAANGQADPLASTHRDWRESLRSHGCTQGKHKGDRGWHGIRLRGAEG